MLYYGRKMLFAHMKSQSLGQNPPFLELLELVTSRNREVGKTCRKQSLAQL